jgi:uncharacterized YigZ family protein
VYVPKRSHSTEARIKNSRFIARAEPFTDPRAVKARVEDIRSANPGCAHVVHTFSVGDAATRSFGMSDDGEPHGTAGRPALDVLRGSEITNCLVTIVRYFGGTKLGTGGLVRAYGGITKEVLAALPVRPLVNTQRCALTVPYELYDPVRRILGQSGMEIETEEFAETVRIGGRIPVDAAAACNAALREATAGGVELDLSDEG